MVYCILLALVVTKKRNSARRIKQKNKSAIKLRDKPLGPRLAESLMIWAVSNKDTSPLPANEVDAESISSGREEEKMFEAN